MSQQQRNTRVGGWHLTWQPDLSSIVVHALWKVLKSSNNLSVLREKGSLYPYALSLKTLWTLSGRQPFDLTGAWERRLQVRREAGLALSGTYQADPVGRILEISWDVCLSVWLFVFLCFLSDTWVHLNFTSLHQLAINQYNVKSKPICYLSLWVGWWGCRQSFIFYLVSLSVRLILNHRFCLCCHITSHHIRGLQ